MKSNQSEKRWDKEGERERWKARERIEEKIDRKGGEGWWR